MASSSRSASAAYLGPAHPGQLLEGLAHAVQIDGEEVAGQRHRVPPVRSALPSPGASLSSPPPRAAERPAGAPRPPRRRSPGRWSRRSDQQVSDQVASAPAGPRSRRCRCAAWCFIARAHRVPSLEGAVHESRQASPESAAPVPRSRCRRRAPPSAPANGRSCPAPCSSPAGVKLPSARRMRSARPQPRQPSTCDERSTSGLDLALLLRAAGRRAVVARLVGEILVLVVVVALAARRCAPAAAPGPSTNGAGQFLRRRRTPRPAPAGRAGTAAA